MKYKNINAAIHNFGHSFTSLMNYVDNAYVMDELSTIHANGYNITVDWLTGEFEPAEMATPRITKAIGYWRDSLKQHMASHNVELSAFSKLAFNWPVQHRKQMFALDNRGKEYKIYVNETK